MREIRPSGLEGGVALTRHPYPYPKSDYIVGLGCSLKNIRLLSILCLLAATNSAFHLAA